MKFRPFAEAREYVHLLGLSPNMSEYVIVSNVSICEDVI